MAALSTNVRDVTLREHVQVSVLCALCALVFLGRGVWPGNAVVPFPPEAIEPLRSEALHDGRVTEADLAVGNPVMGDKFQQSLTWDRVLAAALAEGRVPKWCRELGGGAPFVPQMGQPYQPWNLLLLLVRPAPGVYGLWFLGHLVVFGWLGYLFLRRTGCGHAAGLLGAVCLTAGLWTQAQVHHNVILTAALPALGILVCVRAILDGERPWRAAAWLGLGTGFSWLGGMPQISLLVTELAIAYASWLALTALVQRTSSPGVMLRRLGMVGLGLALGAGLSLAQTAPVLLASAETARAAGVGDLVARSLEWDYAVSLIWPDLLHWPAAAYYPDPFDGSWTATRPAWASLVLLSPDTINMPGTNYKETAYAIGLPGLLLALAAPLRGARARETAFFGGVAALALLLATGTWPLPWLWAAVHGAAVGDLKRALFLVFLALAVLAAQGLESVLAGPTRPPRLALAAGILTAVVSGVLFALHLAPAAEIQAAYAWLATRDLDGIGPEQFAAAVAPGEAAANRERLLAAFAAGLAAAVATTLLLALARRRRAFVPLLLLLAAAHPLLVGRGTVVPVAVERVTTPAQVLAPAVEATRRAAGPRPRFQRLARADDPRLVPMLPPNLAAFYGLEDLAIYTPLPPRRREEMMLAIEPDEPKKPSVVLGGAGVSLFRRAASLTHPLCDLLGLRFVLSARPLELPGLVDRTPAGATTPFRLYERVTTLPRATFVTRARVVPDRTERLALLARRDRNVALETILEDPSPPVPSGATARARIHVRQWEDEFLRLDVETDVAGYLRIADPWDPGWTARVDGHPVAILRADHFLRAVWIEPGRHEVVMRYDAPLVTWPERVSAAALLILLGMLTATRRGRR